MLYYAVLCSGWYNVCACVLYVYSHVYSCVCHVLYHVFYGVCIVYIRIREYVNLTGGDTIYVNRYSSAYGNMAWIQDRSEYMVFRLQGIEFSSLKDLVRNIKRYQWYTDLVREPVTFRTWMIKFSPSNGVYSDTGVNRRFRVQ